MLFLGGHGWGCMVRYVGGAGGISRGARGYGWGAGEYGWGLCEDIGGDIVAYVEVYVGGWV